MRRAEPVHPQGRDAPPRRARPRAQIELRVLAHLSRDETLLAAFREGADIHARTASLLFDAPPSEITPDQRRNAKTINFGLIYGMGPQKLAQELKIPLSEAKAFMARYFERLQGLKHFYENVEEMAREQGYVTTLAGRRRPLPDIQAESQQARSLARRQAINTLIQGSAADIIKLAMIHCDKAIEDNPSNVDLWFGRGRIFFALKQYDESIASFRKVVELKPELFEGNYYLGVFYTIKADEMNKVMNEKQYSSQAAYDADLKGVNDIYMAAVPWFEKAHQIKPDDVDTLEFLKSICFRLRDEAGIMEKYNTYNALYKQVKGIE